LNSIARRRSPIALASPINPIAVKSMIYQRRFTRAGTI
jgi:hypothetical protein